jgi:hypothetical protein
MKADLLGNDELAHIEISDPLTAENIPDTEEARLAIHSLARLHQALTCPFNTPDRCFERKDWLKLVLEIVASVHEGICGCQLASSEGQGQVADAFYDLNPSEDALSTRIQEVIDDLAGFFWADSDDSEELVKYHCFRCVQTAAINPTSHQDLLKQTLLNSALDARKLRETLLNKAVRETHKEVDEWREKQHDHLISFISESITSGPEATAANLSDAVHGLSPSLYSWVSHYREDMRKYVRGKIAQTVNEDLIDPYGRELVDEALAHRRKTIEAEADAEFDRPTVRANRLAALTAELDRDLAHTKANIVAEGEAILAAERAAIAAAATDELNKYREEVRIKTVEEKARLDDVAVTAVRRSSRLAATKPTPSPQTIRRSPNWVNVRPIRLTLAPPPLLRPPTPTANMPRPRHLRPASPLIRPRSPLSPPPLHRTLATMNMAGSSPPLHPSWRTTGRRHRAGSQPPSRPRTLHALRPRCRKPHLVHRPCHQPLRSIRP